MEFEVKLDNWDVAVVVLYFIAVLLTGIYSLFTSNRGTVSGYFLAGRFMTWLPVGASLFASNIGSEHFIGLAGSGAARGIGIGAFELNACLLLQLLGWVFLPVFISSMVSTLPEYMDKRFGGSRIQVYLAVLSLILYIFTKISVNLYSGSLFISEALGWSIWPSIIFLLAITTVITLIGGLAAVIYTDTMQCFVMIIGATILAILSFVKVGGMPGLLESYGSSIAQVDTNTTYGNDLLLHLADIVSMEKNSSNAEVAPGDKMFLSSLLSGSKLESKYQCTLPSPNAFVLLRGIDDPDMPWLGFFLGQTPTSIWYWCADQIMVQRVLAAKSLSHARGATLFASCIKLLPLFVMVLPGMISRVLFPDTVGCATPESCLLACGQRNGCSNLAYPKLVLNLMPTGLRGVMLSVMLAALVSDLTSIFNSSSTIFTIDIYTKIRKRAKNHELMIVGRLFVLVMVVLSILWIPVVQELQGGQLYVYIQAVSSYLTPPIASVYLIAILYSGSNEKGVFCGLMYGLIIGCIRMLLDFVYRQPACGDLDTRPWIVAQLHYMYFALISFFTTGIVAIVLSVITTHMNRTTSQEGQDYKKKDSNNNELTYWSVMKRHRLNEASCFGMNEISGTSFNSQSGINEDSADIICSRAKLTSLEGQKEIPFHYTNQDEIIQESQQIQGDRQPDEDIRYDEPVNSVTLMPDSEDIGIKPNFNNLHQSYTSPSVNKDLMRNSATGDDVTSQLYLGNLNYDILKKSNTVSEACRRVLNDTLRIGGANFEDPNEAVSRQQPHCTCCPPGRISNLLAVLSHLGLWLLGFREKPCPPDFTLNCYICQKCRHPSQDVTENGFITTDRLESIINEQKQQLAKITCLRQSRSARIVLNTGLVAIIIITVTIFIFFSLFFGPIPIGPIPVLTRGSTESKLNVSLTELSNLGIIKLIS